MPVYLIWLKYISWFYYANEAMLITVWTNVNSIACSLPASFSNCKNSRCFDNGNVVLSALKIESVSRN